MRYRYEFEVDSPITKCEDCPFCPGSFGRQNACSLRGEFFQPNVKPKNCPLIEVTDDASE